MKNLILPSFLLLSLSQLADASPRWISVDSSILERIKPHLTVNHEEIFVGEKATVLKMSEAEVQNFSEAIHHRLNRCGGFAGFERLSDAKSSADNNDESESGTKLIFTDYSINQQALTSPMMDQGLLID